MKEWFSNSVSWLSSGTSQQNQPQSPFHGFPQPSQIPNSHHPPLYQPQSPQHVQFGQKVSSQDQMHNQRPQHLPNNDMERKNTMIQELKDNYDGWYFI